jgi:predicted ester cyclase
LLLLHRSCYHLQNIVRSNYFGQNPIKHNQQVLGREGFKEAGLRFFEEFRDSRTEIDRIVAEGEKVLAMLTVTATGNETKNRVTIKSPKIYTELRMARLQSIGMWWLSMHRQ